MAECSQELKKMLDAFYEEAYEDGRHGQYMSGCADEKGRHILQYVAELEASRRALITLGYGGLSGAAA